MDRRLSQCNKAAGKLVPDPTMISPLLAPPCSHVQFLKLLFRSPYCSQTGATFNHWEEWRHDQMRWGGHAYHRKKITQLSQNESHSFSGLWPDKQYGVLSFPWWCSWMLVHRKFVSFLLFPFKSFWMRDRYFHFSFAHHLKACLQCLYSWSQTFFLMFMSTTSMSNSARTRELPQTVQRRQQRRGAWASYI